MGVGEQSQVEFVLEVMKLAGAVFMGALIPIALHRMERRADRASRAEDWFIERYVEQGVDVLDELVGQWATLANIPAPSARHKLALPIFSHVPAQAMARVSPIVNGPTLRNWFNEMFVLWKQAHNMEDLDRCGKARLCSHQMCEHLHRLRLGLMEAGVKSRADSFRLRSLPCVAAFNAAVKSDAEQLGDFGVASGTTRVFRAGSGATAESVPAGATPGSAEM